MFGKVLYEAHKNIVAGEVLIKHLNTRQQR